MNENYTPLNFSHKGHEDALFHAKNHHIGLRAALFSVYLLFIVFAYNFMQMEQLTLRVWNRSFADAGMFLIGISFALSGLCYFYNFVDSKILYRRDLGLNGFYLIALHGLYSFLLNKHIAWHDYLEKDRLLAFIPAVIALLIFFCMALISNKYAAKKLGSERWKTFLRIGYIAYILGAIHSGFWSYEDWQMWFGDASLPPITLVITAFVGLVVLIRAVLWWVLKNKKS